MRILGRKRRTDQLPADVYERLRHQVLNLTPDQFVMHSPAKRSSPC
jgi:hypothetical protein